MFQIIANGKNEKDGSEAEFVVAQAKTRCEARDHLQKIIRVARPQAGYCEAGTYWWIRTGRILVRYRITDSVSSGNISAFDRGVIY